jgi:7-keto-8-aminopelargonate synthetase-like enzyme
MTPSGSLTGRTVSGQVSARITIEGREYINFFGSGYLALANVPEIRRAAGLAI